MKSNKTSRVMQILTTLQAGKSCTVDNLSKMFGTSRRTIFRDLKELRAIGVPYRYDSKSGSYTIEQNFFLPPANLSPQEALSLLMLVHKARDQIQLPFKNSAVLAALKIESNLPAEIRQYCNSALRNISTKAATQTPANMLDKIFTDLQKAILNKRKVNIRYHSPLKDKIIDIELCPYHSFYNHRAWYVLGHSNIHKGVRAFELSRIKEFKISNEHFLSGEDFDFNEYIGRAWSMMPEGRIYNIKLRFSPKVANHVTEVQWHSTQKVTHNSDGSATVEFRVDGLGEISWWILGYGDQVQVLAPKALRKKVLEKAKKIIKLNEKL